MGTFNWETLEGDRADFVYSLCSNGRFMTGNSNERLAIVFDYPPLEYEDVTVSFVDLGEMGDYGQEIGQMLMQTLGLETT